MGRATAWLGCDEIVRVSEARLGNVGSHWVREWVWESGGLLGCWSGELWDILRWSLGSRLLEQERGGARFRRVE